MAEGIDEKLQAVSDLLWRERDLLDTVAYKLEMERIVLERGLHRWLPRAARELGAVLDRLRSIELGRALRVDELAEALGLGPSPTLRQLAAAAPEPWGQILADHHEAFRLATEEIRAATAANRGLIHDGRTSTRTALAWLAPPGSDPVGHALVDDAGRS